MEIVEKLENLIDYKFINYEIVTHLSLYRSIICWFDSNQSPLYINKKLLKEKNYETKI
jgi:hypothetical protein